MTHTPSWPHAHLHSAANVSLTRQHVGVHASMLPMSLHVPCTAVLIDSMLHESATHTTNLRRCCRVNCAAPSSEVCKVEAADGLNLYTAPCSNAPVVQKSGRDVVIKQGDTFQYLDRNSRQSTDCAGFGYGDPVTSTPIKGLPNYCWVLASYKGITGWVQTQEAPGGSTSALCTKAPPSFFDRGVIPLVSDDGSATGCAEQTVDLRGETDACFPADATVMLRGGVRVRLSEVALGHEVAVRQADGSLAWEPVYAFGHRDSSKMAEFTELKVVTSLDNGAEVVKAIQVGNVGTVLRQC